MLPIVEISVPERGLLAPLFAGNRRDLVLIRSVLEGLYGSSWADSATQPTVARLSSGAFTMLGGEARSPAVAALLRCAPITYISPEHDDWKLALQREFGERLVPLGFREFSSSSLELAMLEAFVQALPAEFVLRRIDAGLAERLPAELGNPYFLENFHSIDDFLSRGIGYCILHGGQIVSAASSMAACPGAIDVEIETAPAYRRQGLGTAVGAKLAAYCVEHQIEPMWIASSAESGELAEKLGYTKEEAYLTFEVQA